MSGGAGGEPKAIRCRRCGCGHFVFEEVRTASGRPVRRAWCRHCGARIATALGVRADIPAGPAR